MKKLEPSIRAGLLANFWETVLRLGGDPAAIIGETGLAADILGNASVYIAYRDYLNLLDCASRQTACPHFGLELSRHLRAESMGITGFAMVQAKTVADAWKTLARFYHVHDTYGRVQLQVRGASARISYSIPSYLLPGARQSIDVAAGVGTNISRMLIGSQFRAEALCFPYPEPEDLTAYAFLDTNCLKFSQPTFAIVHPASWLQREVKQQNPQVMAMLENYLESLGAEADRSTRRKVEQLIRGFVATGECTVSRIAGFLSISGRTLQNRLEAEGVSFHQLLESIRQDLAIEHLQRGDMPLGQLAELLGYSELSAFSRSFKRWFGRSPRQYRRELSLEAGELRAGQPISTQR